MNDANGARGTSTRRCALLAVLPHQNQTADGVASLPPCSALFAFPSLDRSPSPASAGKRR